MRILQVIGKPQRRGAEIFAFQLGGELRRQGHHVKTIYLYFCGGNGTLRLGDKDCALNGQEDHIIEKFPGVHPRLLWRLLQLVNEFQPNVVQVGGGRTVKYGALATYFYRNRSWVLVCRNIGNVQDWVRGWGRRLFYQRLVMPRVDGVVSVTRASLQQFDRLYALNVPIVCIPTGVYPLSLNATRRRELVRNETQTPMNAPVALFVGSLIQAKRPDRLLRVVRQVLAQGSDLYLWIVGDGPLRSALEEQAVALGISDNVRFLGVQSEIGTYMRSADLLLLTSDSEGIPRVILEAGLIGLPVVSTRIGGISDFVFDEETGLLSDPGDEAGLVRAVVRLLKHPEERFKMGERATAFARANFTIEKICEEYLGFYQKVLAG